MTEEVLNEVENKDEQSKNEKTSKSAFIKVKERFSIRSKKKKSRDINQDSDESKKGSNGETVEIVNVNVTEKIVETEVKEDKADEEKEKKAKSGGTLERVKMRLSTKKKKSSKDVSGTTKEDEKNDTLKDEKQSSDDDTKEKEDTTKEDKSKNLLQRILRFFRSKKNKDVADADKTVQEADVVDDETKKDENSSDEEDNEIMAICGKSEEEEEKGKALVIPIITTNKPPLPAGRRLPSSATTSHTRPMSQLDEALKQFKLSTAASRENIRNSRQDLSQMEEQVKVQLRSRPATPVLSGRVHLEHQDTKLCASLSDLRQ